MQLLTCLFWNTPNFYAVIKLADTEFKGELIKASLIANPCGAGKAKTEEQTEKPYIADIGNGAFSNLKGLHKTNAKMQMVLRMIAGKGNNLTETFGEDIQENNYAFKIAGIASRLDSQLKEEEERTGVRPERLNWSYARKGAENSYVSTQDIGITDERVKKHCEEMPVEEKAERVVSVQRFDGEMDVGQRTHFRHNHWITGEFIEEHSDVQVTVNRPVMPLPTPVMKAKDKFPIAGIEGYEEGVAIFGVPNMMIHKVSMSRNNMKRGIKTANDINILKAFLTAEPQFASEIAEKAGMTVQKTSQLLKTAMNAGEIKMKNLKNTVSRKTLPAFFI